ncbi:MAG TPA: hypothetical protein VKE22_11205 [Haliangiales bacterium]|nr:hypothetical protein [Haliangiales bacterium]
MKRTILLLGVLLTRTSLADDSGVPGGKISSEPRDCGAAKNHCQRGDAWFVTGYANEIGREGMRPAFRRDDQWRLWDATIVDAGTAYRTKSASAATLEPGRRAVVFAPSAGRPKQPATELEALTSKRWSVVVVSEVDSTAGTFVGDGVTYSIEAARVLSDPQGI